MVVKGERNGRVGVGPTLLPQILWMGSRTQVQVGGREWGGWRYTSLGARDWVMGLKEGRQPHVGKVRSQKPITSTVLLLNIPCLNWNACWQLAAAYLLTPTYNIHQHLVQPCVGVEEKTTTTRAVTIGWLINKLLHRKLIFYYFKSLSLSSDFFRQIIEFQLSNMKILYVFVLYNRTCWCWTAGGTNQDIWCFYFGFMMVKWWIN